MTSIYGFRQVLKLWLPAIMYTSLKVIKGKFNQKPESAKTYLNKGYRVAREAVVNTGTWLHSLRLEADINIAGQRLE